MSPADWLLLEGVVAGALIVEAVTGFGATVLTVAVGSLVLPIAELLPAYVPVNLLLSVGVAWRDRARVDRPLLLGRVLPAMLLGMPLGMWIFARLGAHAGAAELAFGLFVVAFALFRLLAREPARGALGAGGLATLGAAGLVHGAFGTGGPLVILAIGRLGLDKGRFRATLAALWLLLSLPLLASFYAQGSLGAASATRSLALLPALAVGSIAGQFLHGRVSQATFARLVYGLLLVAGGVLVLRAAS